MRRLEEKIIEQNDYILYWNEETAGHRVKLIKNLIT